MVAVNALSLRSAWVGSETTAQYVRHGMGETSLHVHYSNSVLKWST
jgi:hypothetical protein